MKRSSDGPLRRHKGWFGSRNARSAAVARARAYCHLACVGILAERASRVPQAAPVDLDPG